MKTKRIKIKGYDCMVSFFDHACLVKGDVILRKGRFSADAKSFLGIVSLDLSEGVTVEYPADAAEFEKYIERFEMG